VVFSVEKGEGGAAVMATLGKLEKGEQAEEETTDDGKKKHNKRNPNKSRLRHQISILKFREGRKKGPEYGLSN
jgi:hypothetical protein